MNETVLEKWSVGEMMNVTSLLPHKAKVSFLFNIPGWSDAAIGGLLLVIALILMSSCLVLIVKVLKSSLEGYHDSF